MTPEEQRLTYETACGLAMRMLVRGMTVRNPLLEMLVYSGEVAETQRWRAGDPDVSMGITYEMTGWGQA